MKITEMKNSISKILLNDRGFGITSYVCMKDSEQIRLKKLLLDDKLINELKKMFKGVIELQFLSEDIILDSVENIGDNRNVLYEIVQTEEYYPFDFEEQYKSVNDCYKEKDLKNISGFAFRFNLNDEAIWIYQQINYSQIINRSKNIYAILSKKDVYTSLNKNVIKIENKVDMLFIGDSIITSKINILQRNYGFETYVRNEAGKTIAKISSMELVEDVDVLVRFGDKIKLTNAKKILKANNSPVLRMEKAIVLIKIQTLPRYVGKFEIVNDKIRLSTQKDVGEFLKMLNDDILKSELTESEYDSPIKTELSPL